nr:capsid protein [Cressdnaviricota sp.]UOF82584.1 capsid protein [Cressdnaviricota sp.]
MARYYSSGKWFKLKRRKKRPYARQGRSNAWYNQKYSFVPMDVAMSALKGVRYLKTLVNSEMYKYDKTSNILPDSTGATIALSDIAQGDGDNQRTGLSIFSNSLYFRLKGTIHVSATATQIRILLVRDNQQIGDTSPSISDVLEGIGMETPLNNTTVGRFTILRDWVINLNSQGTQNFFRQAYIPCYKHIRYNGTASTDVQKNGLYLLHMSNEVTNTPSLYYYSRLNYRDN